jgi:NMD protein affecting ribosome stability and mRNA decay
MELKEGRKCKKCGKPIDAIGASRYEGHCHDCFSEKVSKLVHPF